MQLIKNQLMWSFAVLLNLFRFVCSVHQIKEQFQK